MSQRVLPAPDPYAVCPRDGRVLPFYGGAFEAAFVILSPFMRPKSAALAPADVDLDELDADELCKNYESVRWSEVRDLCGFPSIASVDVALRTMIGGLKTGYANKELADAMTTALQKNGVLPPVEGVFPALIQEPVLSFFQSLAQDWLWAGDEFGTERKLHWIDDLKPASAKSTLIRGSVFTPDKANLWTAHWDSHFTLFCSSALTVDRLAKDHAVEGFVCDPETEIYWSLQRV